MNSETEKFIVHQVADRIGLAINAKLTTTGDGQTCECFPADVHPNESFAISFHLKWRSAEAVLMPGRSTNTRPSCHRGFPNDQARPIPWWRQRSKHWWLLANRKI